ncbi:MAG: MFS transporter, partial [Erysipelotrichaceae bacterium]|nr:MFS transporter [Erysipelotrichaceae bacterium]
MKRSRTRTIVSIAVLGALAGVLMFIKFPIPIAPSFYKLEFSDTAALIGGFAMGPLAAVLICFIKNLINVIFEGTTTAFVGEISNFIMSCALCLGVVGYTCLSFVQNVGLLYALAVVIGIGSAFSTTVPIAILLTRWFNKSRGTAMSITFAGSSIGAMLLSPLISKLIATNGWRMT